MHAHPRARLAALAVLSCTLLGAGSAARAQGVAPSPTPPPSVESLVAALSGGPVARSFRRTELPEAGTSLCAGQGATAVVATAAIGGATARNLEVVPYAGDTTPGVNLSVQFATASDKLTAADQQLLDTLASALATPALAQDRFAIAGHTDSTGDARINMELSCARALAVRGYLARKGVAAPRLSAYGFGSTRLLAAEQPTAGVNRRVEVRKAPD